MPVRPGNPDCPVQAGEVGSHTGGPTAQGAYPGRPWELHPLGIERGGSGRAVRAAGMTAKRKSALSFLRRKDKWETPGCLKGESP